MHTADDKGLNKSQETDTQSVRLCNAVAHEAESTLHPMLSHCVSIGLGSNDICRKCRTESGVITNALGPWLIANPSCQQPTVLFVGKVARGDCLGREIADYLEDVTGFGDRNIRHSNGPFFGYTRDIITRAFGSLSEGLPRVSFTNMVKCNNESTPDTSTYLARRNCIAENRFIWRDIEQLRPRLVVFYTGRAYDDFIDDYMPSFATTWREHADTIVEVGRKSMPWWEISFSRADGSEVLRFLRVGHPQFKARKRFVELIGSWLHNQLKV